MCECVCACACMRALVFMCAEAGGLSNLPLSAWQDRFVLVFFLDESASLNFESNYP